jgi:acetylornithine aminotransferase
VAASFVPGDHGSTFGGQPLAMSAARATLAVMEEANVPELARQAGEKLATGLAALPHVRAVRGQGLLLAAELTGEFAPAACRAALDAGLIVNAPRTDSLRLAPPLLVSEGEITEALSVLDAVLASLPEAVESP